MRIAIIGSGISGLVAAHRLHPDHELTLFEAANYLGGHTNTVTVRRPAATYAVDTGFIVFNDRTYPNFCQLLRDLGVASDPTTMSFSVRCDRTQLEYNGTSLNGLFSQRRNLLRPRFLRMCRDVLRFNREAPAALNTLSDSETVDQFVSSRGYSEEFSRFYLLPMGSAIWSCPVTTFARFPIRFIIEFYANHGLLALRDRPVWRVIRGGSRTYVESLSAPFRNQIRLSTPVLAVERRPGHVLVRTAQGDGERFDEVIFACHSDQALAILGSDASALERELLSQFPYETNHAVLHTDTSLLPRRRRAWAAWNYRLSRNSERAATVTYNMSLLQHLDAPEVFCVTLNDQEAIDPQRTIATFRYSHPVFNVGRAAAQQRHPELIRNRRTSFCGAYWGAGFHEDGVNSALAVCQRFREKPVIHTREAVLHV